MSERQVIVVDCETSGLNPLKHAVLEVAWYNMETNEGDVFVPPIDVPDMLANADLDALRINDYVGRISLLGQEDRWSELLHQLKGNTLAGSNPAFDASFMMRVFSNIYYIEDEPWHHRKLDISSYAAGITGTKLNELEGLSTIAQKLNVKNEAPHTAWGDVMTTVRCLRILQDMNCDNFTE